MSWVVTFAPGRRGCLVGCEVIEVMVGVGKGRELKRYLAYMLGFIWVGRATVWSRQLERQLSNPALLALMLLLPLASVAIAACSELYEPDSRVWFGRLVEANPRFTPQWSHDGAHVVFTLNWPRNGNSNNGSTYVARSDGSSVRRVSEGTGEYNVDSLVKTRFEEVPAI